MYMDCYYHYLLICYVIRWDDLLIEDKMLILIEVSLKGYMKFHKAFTNSKSDFNNWRLNFEFLTITLSVYRMISMNQEIIYSLINLHMFMLL